MMEDPWKAMIKEIVREVNIFECEKATKHKANIYWIEILGKYVVKLDINVEIKRRL